ncbi:CRISPR-associated helicase Cas3' [Saccharopolyspora sp. NPDC047091]|uniref:CRISPR-associated helicase Cas3' n=1 Tax=Saccharopolyspora sp. NPDC047091 TaxID=3155924 RepID=UPI003408F555
MVVEIEAGLRRWLGALWGKSASRGGGRRNLLLSHMLDTAAVAECLWDGYLPAVTRELLDRVAGGPGRGRRFFAWLCGIHDCGKATPAFQCVDADCAAAVWHAGLRWDEFKVGRARWRHDKAGAVLLRRVLPDEGWVAEQVAWVWPLVAGHHGRFPDLGELVLRGARLRAVQVPDADWAAAQAGLVRVFTEEVGFGAVAAVQPSSVPSRAEQLQLSGLIVMADWIASRLDGIDELEAVSMDGARDRARGVWAELGLRGGWGKLPVPGMEVFQDRFGRGPRASQSLVLEVARKMPAPGLMVVEAPMGEGKTKGALGAAEVFAARFGADGVFFGMPTQATCDPMFGQVREWVERIEPGLGSQVALLHGKRALNAQWRALLDAAAEDPDDDFGTIEEDAALGLPQSAGAAGERLVPAEWFLGRLRGLLCPFVVGTIDQLLFAATRTKHVMLRMAGLVGKVVVLDEVHAADVYMSQFLKEGLRWLGQAGVPVVLLSATLPPAQRDELLAAYLSGATGEEHEASGVPRAAGYPSVTAVWADEHGKPAHAVEHCGGWRDDLRVRVSVADESPTASRSSGDSVADLVQERLTDGGTALVIRNTVDRVQETYVALRARFGAEVGLLHGRLSAVDRATRTADNLALLGPEENRRPAPGQRWILVASQLAEQSFDVSADLLITDLAPIDLVLQRIGRLHRHATSRPEALREPEVIITGFQDRGNESPWLLPASEAIYGRMLLLRTAATVFAARGGTWSIPSDVPSLVAEVYEGTEPVPEGWSDAERAASDRDLRDRRDRIAKAERFLLTRVGHHGGPTLAGLHRGGAGELGEHQARALVRDGDPSIEVQLLTRDERGYRTINGRSLGLNGDASAEVLDDILGSTVRLPAKLTAAAEEELAPLPAWRTHPWLRHSRALVVEHRGATALASFDVSYDGALGLIVTGTGTR